LSAGFVQRSPAAHAIPMGQGGEGWLPDIFRRNVAGRIGRLLQFGDLRKDPATAYIGRGVVHRHNVSERFCSQRCGATFDGRTSAKLPSVDLTSSDARLQQAKRRTPSRPSCERNDDARREDLRRKARTPRRFRRQKVTGVFLVKQFASTECECSLRATRPTRVGVLEGAVAEAAR